MVSPRTVLCPHEMTSPLQEPLMLPSNSIFSTMFIPCPTGFELGLAPDWVKPSMTIGSVISGNGDVGWIENQLCRAPG